MRYEYNVKLKIRKQFVIFSTYLDTPDYLLGTSSIIRYLNYVQPYFWWKTYGKHSMCMNDKTTQFWVLRYLNKLKINRYSYYTIVGT